VISQIHKHLHQETRLHTRLEEAWISIRLARWANLRVLCVSSLLLDAGVIVQINWRYIPTKSTVRKA
jgi:hypothetical protein